MIITTVHNITNRFAMTTKKRQRNKVTLSSIIVMMSKKMVWKKLVQQSTLIMLNNKATLRKIITRKNKIVRMDLVMMMILFILIIQINVTMKKWAETRYNVQDEENYNNEEHGYNQPEFSPRETDYYEKGDYVQEQGDVSEYDFNGKHNCGVSNDDNVDRFYVDSNHNHPAIDRNHENVLIPDTEHHNQKQKHVNETGHNADQAFLKVANSSPELRVDCSLNQQIDDDLMSVENNTKHFHPDVTFESVTKRVAHNVRDSMNQDYSEFGRTQQMLNTLKSKETTMEYTASTQLGGLNDTDLQVPVENPLQLEKPKIQRKSKRNSARKRKFEPITDSSLPHKPKRKYTRKSKEQKNEPNKETTKVSALSLLPNTWTWRRDEKKRREIAKEELDLTYTRDEIRMISKEDFDLAVNIKKEVKVKEENDSKDGNTIIKEEKDIDVSTYQFQKANEHEENYYAKLQQRGELNTDIKEIFKDMNKKRLDPMAMEKDYFQKCLESRHKFLFRMNKTPINCIINIKKEADSDE